MVSGNRLMAVFTPVATPAVPRDATTPAILVMAVDSAFASCHLSFAVYCPRKFLSPEIPGGVCRGERLTRRNLMMDIAADLLFSDCEAPRYTAGRAGSILSSYGFIFKGALWCLSLDLIAR